MSGELAVMIWAGQAMWLPQDGCPNLGRGSLSWLLMKCRRFRAVGLDHLTRRNNNKHWAWWTKNGWDLICTIKHGASSGRGMPAIPALETIGSGIQSQVQLHSKFKTTLSYQTLSQRAEAKQNWEKEHGETSDVHKILELLKRVWSQPLHSRYLIACKTHTHQSRPINVLHVSGYLCVTVLPALVCYVHTFRPRRRFLYN